MGDPKHLGTDFDDYLIESLKEDNHAVFLHIKNALESPDLHVNNDASYLIQAIKDVATARGKTLLAEQVGISRNGLYKILNGDVSPSLQNVMAILNAIGLKFSVEQVTQVVSNAKPAKVLDVAQYALKFLSRSDTYMKLQKIVYYAQVESLLKHDRPLFGEKIEAWAAGPVVRELYEKHRGRKYIGGDKIGDENHLSLEQKSCIDWTIEKFGKIDGDTLSHITHIEDPWKNARKGLSHMDRSHKEITHLALRKYYSNLPNYEDMDEQEK